MMVTAVVGANWGDEGKGKITDMLAEKADIIIRFQGGANAGHTIINDYGKFALHTLPSGVFYNHTTSIIGNGVALDIPKLFNEVKQIEEGGVPTPKILVSDRAQMVMPYHVLFDTYEEERLAGASFGSTKSGIAPFYSDKYAKIGFQVSELFDDEKSLKEKIERVIVQKNALLENLYHKPLLTVDGIYETLMEYKKIEKNNLEIDVDIDDCYSIVNEDLMEQVWINLIENAIKFNKKNGKIFVKVKKVNDKITISIKDTGVGIDEDKINRIFDKFYTTSEKNGKSGNGLGLALTKKILNLHNGSIEANSKLNKGTEFIILLNSV